MLSCCNKAEQIILTCPLFIIALHLWLLDMFALDKYEPVVLIAVYDFKG